MPYGSIRPSSYYDRTFRQGASLIRARRPYLFKNALVGVSIVGFTMAAYVYTLKAIGTDEFEDVVPAQRREG
ncbi:hypothetical protein BT63DRAFT_449664 [Microthyrium microscopicum]|uniref:Cytochrome c oxidase assembly factor 3 n=1 Tax=Microthyrium microscopicum TaxID=703497 RepID=A0A6A6UQW3_9PEZI|nr:hypothetical protein BT63DRAFT_449664 [Microthyrium microscopicum]